MKSTTRYAIASLVAFLFFLSFVFTAAVVEIESQIILVPIAIFWLSLSFMMICCYSIAKRHNASVTTCRLVLVFPILPFVWLYYYCNSKSKKLKGAKVVLVFSLNFSLWFLHALFAIFKWFLFKFPCDFIFV